MGDTLPESHLSQLILRWRHSIKYPELRYVGWQHGGTPPILNPLASRRKWSAVPDFVQMLSGTTNAALDAAYALVEMGVYQAATAIDKAMQTSTKRYSGEEMVERPLRTYMQAIVRVELLGATSNLVPLELLLENEQDDLRDGTFHDHLGIYCVK